MTANPNHSRSKICDKIEGELAKLHKMIDSTFLESRTDAERDSMVNGIDAQQNKIAALFGKLPPRPT